VDHSNPTVDLDVLLAHGPFLRTLARSLVHDPGLADDLVQEAWLAALRAPRQGVRRLGSWLTGAVRHLARGQRRETERRLRREAASARPEGTVSTEEVVAREELRRLLVQHLLALDEPYRSTLLLRFHEGLPPRAIAARRKVPVETVKTHLKRGLADLRARLDSAHGGDRSLWLRSLLPLAVGALLVRRATQAAAALAAVVVLTVAVRSASGPRSVGGPVAEAPPRPAPTPGGAPAGPLAASDSGATGPGSETGSTPSGDEAALTGRVVDQEGRALPEARVFAVPLRPERPTRLDESARRTGLVRGAITDSYGRFRIRPDPGPPYWLLLADALGRSPGLIHAVRPGSQETLRLLPGRVLAGRVLNEERQPLEGARIRWFARLAGMTLEREALSGPDGTWRVADLPRQHRATIGAWAETWALEVRAAGWAPLLVRDWSGLIPDEGRYQVLAGFHGRVRLEPRGGEEQLDLFLARGEPIRGRVATLGTGASLARARVALWTPHLVDARGGYVFEEVEADENGSFLFPHAGGSGVAAWAPGHAPTDWAWTPEKRETLVILCPPGGAVRGRVLDPGGRPCSGIEVSSPLPGHSLWTPTVLQLPGWPRPGARTDAEGRFLLEGLPASSDDAPATLMLARPESVLHFATTTAMVRAGEVTELPPILLRGADRPDGKTPVAVLRVEDEQGRPVCGAEPSCQDPTGETRTDHEGRLALLGSRGPEPWGRMRIGVWAPGFAAAVTELFEPSTANPPEVRVTMARARRVTGRVVWEDGSPAAGVRVHAIASGMIFQSAPFSGEAPPPAPTPEEAEQWSFLGRFTAETDESGGFELRNLPEGPYRLEARRIHSLGPKLTPMLSHFGGDGRYLDPKVGAVVEGVPSDATGVELHLADEAPDRQGTGSIELTVTLGDTGRPAGGANVWLRGPVTAPEAHEVEPGFYRILRAPAGRTWRLCVKRNGCVPHLQDVRVPAKGAHVALSISLDPGVAVSGKLEGYDFEAWLGEGPFVYFHDLLDYFEGAGGGHTVVRADRQYRVSGLAPGSYRVSVVAMGENGIPEPDWLSIPPGVGDVALDIRLRPGRQVRIWVNGAGFGRQSDASRELKGRAESSRVECRDAHGKLVWQNVNLAIRPSDRVSLEFGDYTVRLIVPGLPLQERTIRVAPDAFPDVVFTVP